MCFMVSKEIGLALWLWQLVNLNIAVITIQIYRGLVQIINVYNFSVVGVLQIENIVSIISLLETENTKTILLGDMNLYYLQWGGIYVAPYCQAECLLKAIDNGGLKLATPPGAIIWQQGSTKSTINIIIIDKNLYQRLKRYTPKEEQALTLDHIPIQIQLNLDIKAQPNSKRYIIRKLNIDSFLNIIKQ